MADIRMLAETPAKVYDETPRERMVEMGAAALSTVELMAILLRTGEAGSNALELASKVLSRAGSLRGLAAMSPGDVAALEGIGTSRAAQILAALELARRFAEEEVRMAETLGGAEEAYKFLRPREVIKEALKENAAAVILCHNHPSGHVSPSPDDLRLTEELKGVLQKIDVRVIDHLIVGGNGYFSFAREGLLT